MMRAAGRQARSRFLPGLAQWYFGGVTARGLPAWAQALPLAIVFVVFFIVPLLLTLMVSFWNYNEYEILPDFTARNYLEAFEGCAGRLVASRPNCARH